MYFNLPYKQPEDVFAPQLHRPTLRDFGYRVLEEQKVITMPRIGVCFGLSGHSAYAKASQHTTTT
jgi:hypothetical protein